MERVKVDGVTVRVFKEGSGPEVIYFHSGFGEMGPIRFLTELAASGFTVVALEMPGFGASESSRDWHKIEDAIFFYRRALDTLEIDYPALVGQSLGGWIAAEIAVWFPERVRAMVLIDSVGLYVEGEPIHELFGVEPIKLMPLVFPSGGNIVEHVVPALEGNLDSDSVLLHFFRAMEATAAIGWSPYMHDPKLRERLKTVRAPALVIHGEKDGIVPVAHSEVYAAELPKARLEILDGLGHLPALEQPSMVAGIVTDFLR